MPYKTVENFQNQPADIVSGVKNLLKSFEWCGKHYSLKYST